MTTITINRNRKKKKTGKIPVKMIMKIIFGQ